MAEYEEQWEQDMMADAYEDERAAHEYNCEMARQHSLELNARFGDLEAGVYGTCDWGDCHNPANAIRNGRPLCDECLNK